MSEKLNQAISVVKSGDRETANRLLKDVIKDDPGSKEAENAWLWMSAVLEDPQQKKRCLETVLKLNPDNSAAKKGLTKLAATASEISSTPLNAHQSEQLSDEEIRDSGSFEETSTSFSSWMQNLSTGEITIKPFQWLGISGCILLMVGIFAPLIRIPIVGSVNYFQNGKGDGVFILILAIISLALLIIGRFKWLWITGFASLGLISFTLIFLVRLISELESTLQEDLSDNLFSGLASLLMESVQIEWGWLLLVGGAILVLAAAALLRGHVFPWKHFAAGLALFVVLFASLSIFRAQAFDTSELAETDSSGQRLFEGDFLSSSEDTSDKPEMVSLGEPIVYEDGTLEVLQVQNPTGYYVVEALSFDSEGVEPIPGISYAAVELEFTCSTTSQVLCDTIPEASLELVLEDGRTVADDDYRLHDLPNLGNEDLAAGRTAKGWRVFQVPENATIRWLDVKPFGEPTLRAELPEPVDGFSVVQPWIEEETGNYQIIPALRRDLQNAGLQPSSLMHLETEEQRAIFVGLCEDLSYYFDADEAYRDYQQLIMTAIEHAEKYRNPYEGIFISINDCSSVPITDLNVLFLSNAVDRWALGSISDNQLLLQGFSSLD